MLIDDKFIIDYFFINDKINNNKIKHYNIIDDKTNIDIYNYLINRFNDCLENTSIAEILNRIKYHIEIRPVCKICGNHPYNSDNIDDQNKLNFWKEKNTKFYNTAINIWTIRDVNKRNIAKQNNLNYIEFWNIDELKEWLNKN